jgi:hypothetical protein
MTLTVATIAPSPGERRAAEQALHRVTRQAGLPDGIRLHVVEPEGAGGRSPCALVNEVFARSAGPTLFVPPDLTDRSGFVRQVVAQLRESDDAEGTLLLERPSGPAVRDGDGLGDVLAGAAEMTWERLGPVFCHTSDWPGLAPGATMLEGKGWYLAQKARRSGRRVRFVPAAQASRSTPRVSVPTASTELALLRDALVACRDLGLAQEPAVDAFARRVGARAAEQVWEEWTAELHNPFRHFDHVYIVDRGEHRLARQLTSLGGDQSAVTLLPPAPTPLAHNAAVTHADARRFRQILVADSTAVLTDGVVWFLRLVWDELSCLPWSFCCLDTGSQARPDEPSARAGAAEPPAPADCDRVTSHTGSPGRVTMIHSRGFRDLAGSAMPAYPPGGFRTVPPIAVT